MLRRYVEQILNLYNYVDGLVITDKNGYIEYYLTYRPDVSNLREKSILRKHILEVYPRLTEETSSIMTVLRTGEPIVNQYQELVTYEGQILHTVNTTMPIKENEEIIGAIDVSRYVDEPYERKNISITFKDNKEERKLYTIDDIITNSQSMKIMKNRIPMVAETDSSVMIYGETGTGKELVAQSLHTSSHRKNKRFVSQNCAAIPDNLLESILFGTTKGSYTGAENTPGLFEIANGGTIFLDEINSMDIGIQSKILKVVEEKQVTRLGSHNPVNIDVKVVSAVNVNPIQCVAEKKIRDDLFYRLSVVQINIPPLRARMEDVKALTRYYIDVFNEKMGKNILDVDEEVEELFARYSWPGNVRELRNIIEGAFNIVSGRIIRRMDLPEYFIEPLNSFPSDQMMATQDDMLFEEGFSLDEAINSMEKNMIARALRTTRSQAEAARLLGISRQTLSYKILKHRIEK